MRSTLTGIESALGDPPARIRELLARELAHGRRELERARSGYDHPVVVGFAAHPGGIAAVVPVAASLRADPAAAPERAWLLVAACVGALVEAAADPQLLAGELDGDLVLAGSTRHPDAELAVLAFDEHAGGIDRLRAVALPLPAGTLSDAGDLREPIGVAHPLRVAERVARLGGRPADPASLAEHEDALLAELPHATRPHEDPDPARRVARRILQRLNGMGKWGGYHTEFTHLPRGFAGNERHLAEAVAEALLDAGLLREKRSVGQRHVFLDPRRAGEIHRLIDDGSMPPGLHLPTTG